MEDQKIVEIVSFTAVTFFLFITFCFSVAMIAA